MTLPHCDWVPSKLLFFFFLFLFNMMQERRLHENLLQQLCRRVTDGGSKQQLTLGKHGVENSRKKTENVDGFGLS